MTDQSQPDIRERIEAIREEYSDPKEFVDALVGEVQSAQASEIRQISGLDTVHIPGQRNQWLRRVLPLP